MEPEELRSRGKAGHWRWGVEPGVPPASEHRVPLQPVVAAPVGGGVLPVRVPGGPHAGDAAQAVWTTGKGVSARLGEVAGVTPASWGKPSKHFPNLPPSLPPSLPQEKSPPRTRSANSTLAQALHWTRTQLSPLEAPALLWGLLMAVGAVRVVQALLAPCSLWSSPLAPVSREKRRPASQKDSGAASEQATTAPNPCSSSSRTTRRKK